jgi:hypothetical protein
LPIEQTKSRVAAIEGATMVREKGMDDVIASRSFSTGVGESRRRRCFLVTFFSRLPLAVEASISLGSDIGDSPCGDSRKAENLEFSNFTWYEVW